jgi:hypothetical protein
MTSLVVGNQLFLLQLRVSALLFKTDHNSVDGSINLFPADGGLSGTGGRNCSFIHQVLKLSSRESRGSAGDSFKINIRLKGLSTRVDTQDAGTSLKVGKIDSDLTIKTARTEQRLIQNINTIGGGDSDNTRVSIETIHLYKDLIDSLFTFIVSSSISSSALTTDGINLI